MRAHTHTHTLKTHTHICDLDPAGRCSWKTCLPVPKQQLNVTVANSAFVYMCTLQTSLCFHSTSSSPKTPNHRDFIPHHQDEIKHQLCASSITRESLGEEANDNFSRINGRGRERGNFRQAESNELEFGQDTEATVPSSHEKCSGIFNNRLIKASALPLIHKSFQYSLQLLQEQCWCMGSAVAQREMHPSGTPTCFSTALQGTACTGTPQTCHWHSCTFKRTREKERLRYFFTTEL